MSGDMEIHKNHEYEHEAHGTVRVREIDETILSVSANGVNKEYTIVYTRVPEGAITTDLDLMQESYESFAENCRKSGGV